MVKIEFSFISQIIGWEPDVYTSTSQFQSDMPDDLRNHISGDLIDGTIRPVSCFSHLKS